VLEEAFTRELAAFLFARDHRPVEAIVLDLCRDAGVRIACAESCTGGLVGALLTAVPGSSAAFLGSLVAYADEVKRDVVGVPAALLLEHGAVSAEVAQALAAGARERTGAEVGIGVTGIAGPDGGSEEKPVGLVYVHASAPWGEEALELRGATDREAVRQRAAKSALHVARQLLEENRHSSV
jgi:nicotinamide-nucleotide amidase